MKNNQIILVITTTWFLFASSSSLSFVSALNEVMFIFNNGFTTSPDAACTAPSDIAKIDAVFARNRLLRGTDLESSAVANERELTFSAQCADICQGYAPNTCRKFGCWGFRDLAVDVANEEDRNLQELCTTEINTLHAKLDVVMNQVSTSCSNYLQKSKRRATCFPDYEYGNVQGIRIWNVTTTSQRLVQVPPFVAPGGNFTVCSSFRFNVEALTEPCVDEVFFSMTGPDGFSRTVTEWEAPYALFGDDGTKFRSRDLFPGTYPFTITPDNAPSKKVEFKIIVKPC